MCDNGCSKDDLETYIHGIEILDIKPCIENLSATARAYGFDNVKWDIIQQDALDVKKYNHGMDFVVGNPPYMRIHDIDNRDKMRKLKFCRMGAADLYLAFFEIGLDMLNDNGVLCYITPIQWLTNDCAIELRKTVNGRIKSITDLKFYSPFGSNVYTAITVIQNHKCDLQFYEYGTGLISVLDNYCVDGKFYLGSQKEVDFMREIITTERQSTCKVRMGFQTSADDIFINDADSKFNIPCVKANTGNIVNIYYPYDKNGNLVAESELDNYLCKYRVKLEKRNKAKTWYSFGRTQGIADTYNEKVAINSMYRDLNDLKLTYAPAGTGVYGGMYLTGIDYDTAKKVFNEDYIVFTKLLRDYKQGGYMRNKSSSIQKYVDWKTAN